MPRVIVILVLLLAVPSGIIAENSRSNVRV